MQPAYNYKINEHHIKWIAIIISCILVCINIVRVIYVPITFDEAGTFFDYASSSFYNIVTCNPPTANNHILNSLLTKISIRLFHSYDQFVLRLPNVVAHICYLVFSYKLSLLLFNRSKWTILLILLLNLNPFLFDFWGLCRGYGLSISFMLASIYGAVNYITTDKHKWFIIALSAAVLAVYSNFALLNYYVSLSGVLVFHSAFLKRKEWKLLIGEVVLLLISATLIYLLISGPIKVLTEKQQFYYGGADGFITDTIYSVIYESFYFKGGYETIAYISAYLAAAFVIISGCYWISCLIKNKAANTSRGFLLWLLLFMPALSIMLQHYLFGTLYLIERTALFFYPLFVIHLAYFLGYLSNKRMNSFVGNMLAFIMAGNFIFHTNIAYARTWDYDKNSLVVINRIIQGKRVNPVKIKLYWLFMYSFKYYQQTKYTHQLQHIELRWEDSPAGTVYDYYYINKDDMDIVPPGYSEDTSFFDGKYVLLKKKD